MLKSPTIQSWMVASTRFCWFSGRPWINLAVGRVPQTTKNIALRGLVIASGKLPNGLERGADCQRAPHAPAGRGQDTFRRRQGRQLPVPERKMRLSDADGRRFPGGSVCAWLGGGRSDAGGWSSLVVMSRR